MDNALVSNHDLCATVTKSIWDSSTSAYQAQSGTTGQYVYVPPVFYRGRGNLAIGKTTSASSYCGAGYEAFKANDASMSTRWNSARSTISGLRWLLGQT